MTQARALKQMEVVLNAPYLGVWAEKIGRFILNFGGIELLSYQHLALLEETHEAFVRNLDRSFSKRVDRILTLANASTKLNDKERTKVRDLWEYAQEFAKIRNRIAHNPVLPTWKPGSNPDTDSPDVLGIPDFKQFKEGSKSDSVSIELMDKMIDEAALLAQNLHDSMSRLRSDA